MTSSHHPTSDPSRNPTLESLVENACRKALAGEKGWIKAGGSYSESHHWVIYLSYRERVPFSVACI